MNGKLRPGQEIAFKVTNVQATEESGWGTWSLKPGMVPYQLEVALPNSDGEYEVIFNGDYDGEKAVCRTIRNFLFTVNKEQDIG